GFWKREFGGAVSAVTETMTLGGRPYQIVGVLEEGVRLPTAPAVLYVPFSTIPDSGIPRIRPVRILSVVARARSGASMESVQAEMNAIAGRLAERYPDNRQWDTTAVLPLTDVVS